MTTSVTRSCFTKQHQNCKTKTETAVCKTKTTACKTTTDFLVSDRSCPKTNGLRPHHWHTHVRTLLGFLLSACFSEVISLFFRGHHQLHLIPDRSLGNLAHFKLAGCPSCCTTNNVNIPKVRKCRYVGKKNSTDHTGSLGEWNIHMCWYLKSLTSKLRDRKHYLVLSY